MGQSHAERVAVGIPNPWKTKVSIEGRMVNRPSRDKVFSFQEDALLPWLTAGLGNMIFEAGALCQVYKLFVALLMLAFLGLTTTGVVR